MFSMATASTWIGLVLAMWLHVHHLQRLMAWQSSDVRWR